MKPSIPRGTRDFGPKESSRRQYIFDTIRKVFRLYGFAPIETPAMENIHTLTGKYGEEGDQLIFKILNSRLNDSNKKEELRKEFELMLEGPRNADVLTERALRYDLTVPFARFVVMHQNELAFPFKRYQIQPVWRADKPQKGRYREFYQCDADVIGSDSLINELELVQMTQQVFAALGIHVLIKINNRKVLSGVAEVIGAPDKMIDITVAIDKLDKIGLDKVKEELHQKGLSIETIKKLEPLLLFKGNTPEKIKFLELYLAHSEVGKKGIEELNFIFNSNAIDKTNLELDITLARGLNYYTGAIFEVKVADPRSQFSGSISGGGRYDDLTGMFGLKGLSGVGISYGADRIYDVLEELSLFPEKAEVSTQLLLVNFGEKELDYAFNLGVKLRKEGIATEVFPDTSKMKKQMAYADQKNIPFVAVIGSDEMSSGLITLKDMQSGVQEKLSLEQIIIKFKA